MSVSLLLSSMVYKTHCAGQGLGGWKMRAAPRRGPAMKHSELDPGDVRVKFTGLMGWDHLRPSVTSLFGKSASSLLKWKLRGIESQLAF